MRPARVWRPASARRSGTARFPARGSARNARFRQPYGITPSVGTGGYTKPCAAAPPAPPARPVVTAPSTPPRLVTWDGEPRAVPNILGGSCRRQRGGRQPPAALLSALRRGGGRPVP